MVWAVSPQDLRGDALGNIRSRCTPGLRLRVDGHEGAGGYRARTTYVSSRPLRPGLRIDRFVDYLNSYMRPQAIIVDGSDAETPSFLAAMRTKADHTKQSLIELPEDGAEQFGWLARLDSSSLSGKKTVCRLELGLSNDRCSLG